MAVEGGSFKQCGYLGGKSVTLASDGDELVFELGVGAITGVVALQSLCGDFEAGQAKLSNGGVDLLVDLGELQVDVTVLAQCRWDGPTLEILEEETPIVSVVVLEAEQGEDG